MFLIVDSMDRDSLRRGKVSLRGGLLMLAEAAEAVERQCGTNTPTDTEKVEFAVDRSLLVALIVIVQLVALS